MSLNNNFEGYAGPKLITFNRNTSITNICIISWSYEYILLFSSDTTISRIIIM